MASGPRRLTFGFPRMHKEAGERRDFLPSVVGMLAGLGCEVFVETGIGSGMGLSDADYSDPGVHVVDEEACYRQDVVVVLRAPEGRYGKLRRGAVLISMLHFPTRPARVRMLRELGIEAIGLDTIEDDAGGRLVEDLRAVAWNGVGAAFEALATTWAELGSTTRPPVRVTIMGAGRVGRHAVEAATKFGSVERNEEYIGRGVSGVEVMTIGRNLTCMDAYMRERLRISDVLVDATQRHDPSVPIVSNARVGLLPDHAVICDLVVDPYLLDASPRTVRGIEGIPQGDLDRWVFAPDDPAWDALPPEIPTANRRTTVSCYSWPGVDPRPCMELYGTQLAPLLESLVSAGGIDGIGPRGTFLERALWRGSLRARPAVGA